MKPSHLMIMGVLNYPGIEWSTMMSSGSMQESEFLESFGDWFLFQHSTQPTHYRAKQRANILDVVMTNEEGMVEDLEIGEPVGRSDHVVMSWSLKCYADSIKTCVIKYVYDKGNFDGMRDRLGNIDWRLLLSDKTVDKQWDVFEGEVKKTVEEFVPHSRSYGGGNKHRKPVWMDTRALSRIKKKRETFERYKQTREGKVYIEYTRASNAAKADT